MTTAIAETYEGYETTLALRATSADYLRLSPVCEVCEWAPAAVVERTVESSDPWPGPMACCRRCASG